MKEVIIKTSKLNTVNLSNIDTKKIYAIKNNDGDIFKIHTIDGYWRIICIGNSHHYKNIKLDINTLNEYIKHIMSDYIVYEFKNQKDFFENVDKMKSK